MPLKNIIIHFDKDGNQSGLQVVTDKGEKHWNKAEDGVVANPLDPHANVLWGNRNKLELVEGSYCVVIAGRKYCF